jgi:hypothetical protein
MSRRKKDPLRPLTDDEVAALAQLRVCERISVHLPSNGHLIS